MSKKHDLHNISPKPNLWYGFVAMIGLILTFAVFIGLTYFPNRPEAVDMDIILARKAKLTEVQAAQHKLVSSYEWIDKEAGVVRIPIERAMALTLTQLQK